MSAEQIVERLASTGIQKRSAMIKRKLHFDSSDDDQNGDDQSEKVGRKVSNARRDEHECEH